MRKKGLLRGLSCSQVSSKLLCTKLRSVKTNNQFVSVEPATCTYSLLFSVVYGYHMQAQVFILQSKKLNKQLHEGCILLKANIQYLHTPPKLMVQVPYDIK